MGLNWRPALDLWTGSFSPLNAPAKVSLIQAPFSEMSSGAPSRAAMAAAVTIDVVDGGFGALHNPDVEDVVVVFGGPILFCGRREA